MAEMTMIEALNLALRQEMAQDDGVLVLGEDVGVDGGIFRLTEGLLDEFGEERVIDTPLAESAIIGFSVGLALYGLKPVCEIQFSASATWASSSWNRMLRACAGARRGDIACRWSCACRTVLACAPWSITPRAARSISRIRPASRWSSRRGRETPARS